MGYELFIGTRYLKAKKKRGFLSLITFLSVIGVLLGVMTLVIVTAVMSGADADFKHRILGVSAHVVLMNYGGAFTGYETVQQRVENIPGVEAATPYIYSQVMLRSASGSAMAVVKGVDTVSAGSVVNNPSPQALALLNHTGDLSGENIPRLLLGKVLAHKLKVEKGERLFLFTIHKQTEPAFQISAMRQFEVADVVATGLYDYDQSFCYTGLQTAQELLKIGRTVTGIEIRIKDLYQAESIGRNILKNLGFPYRTQNWMQSNRNIFIALKLQKTVMFIILSLIILVAAFNIAGTLVMTVMEKGKDIAILKAMGATDASIRKIFVFKGMVIGLWGTVTGVCLGYLSCVLLKHYQFIELPEDVYYFKTLPVKIEGLDIVLIVFAALLLCFLASIYPAYRATRLNPVDAIRNE